MTTWWRKAWARYLGLSPSWQGWIAMVPVSFMAGVLFEWFFPWPAWSAPWVVVLAVQSFVIGMFGVHIENVAQARRDLAADAEAMRGAIARLERGDW